jgi:hypothetical protein
LALDENDWDAISHPQDLDVQAWRATATDLGAGLGPRAWDTVASAGVPQVVGTLRGCGFGFPCKLMVRESGRA